MLYPQHYSLPVHGPGLCLRHPLSADPREDPTASHLPGHSLVPTVRTVVQLTLRHHNEVSLTQVQLIRLPWRVRTRHLTHLSTQHADRITSREISTVSHQREMSTMSRQSEMSNMSHQCEISTTSLQSEILTMSQQCEISTTSLQSEILTMSHQCGILTMSH